ncbi:hypothetical protein MTO96_013383 [Rhipicephalus appendiculatus]
MMQLRLNYHEELRENKQRYLSRCSYPVPGLSRKYSIEGIVKIIGASACIVSDLNRIFRHDHSLDQESVQHHSMYAFFLLNGVVDVMYNAGFPLPPHADYAALLLTIISEGLMFHLHLGGKPPLNVMIHTLLVYTAAALAVCIIAEVCRPRSVLVSLGRAYFCLLHGAWLWQIAFILYNPLPGHEPWDVHSHMDMMLAASVFSWHMMAVLVYVGAWGAVAWVVNRKCGRFCEVVSVNAEEIADLREALVKHDI